MKTDTQINGDTVTVKVADSGDDLERVLRHWNKQGFYTQAVEADFSGNIQIVFRKAALFENYR